MKDMVDAADATDGAMLSNQATYSVYAAVNGVDTDLANARLNTITSDAATLTAAQANTSTNEAGVDTVLTTAQDVLAGTVDNDFFRAVAGVQVGQQDQTTLNSSDIIDGSVGSDTLIVNMTGPTYIGGARIKNIEDLKIGTNLAAATFDYNVNMGSNEITEVTTLTYDQINTGEDLTVNNILKTGTSIPTIVWDNEANSTAGEIDINFRQSAVDGATTLSVKLDDVLADVNNNLTGRLNIATSVETLNLDSAGTSGRNTLNQSDNTPLSGNTVDIASGTAGSLTTVVLTGSQEIGKAATVITTTTDANYGYTNRAVNSDLGIDNATTAVKGTASNLLSVDYSVATVDASAMTAASNVRFTADAVLGAAKNVTYKGGSANDYVEFEAGTITATGGEGSDTFAFVNANTAKSGFDSTDSISGGAGTDAIQLGVNGAGTYTLNTTEFNNKTGIDVLDLRGNSNTVTLADSFVSSADAGTFKIYTSKIIQTSDTNTANPSGRTAGNNYSEDNAVTILDTTVLSQNRAFNFEGGSGSDRLVMDNDSYNQFVTIAGGTNVGNNGAAAVAGDYDTLTIVNGANLDAGDLANTSGFESMVLTDTTVGNQSFQITLTEAFLSANTAASDTAATAADERAFYIVTDTPADVSGGAVLAAGDVVQIDITDLLNSTGTALKSSLTGRYVDVSSIEATGATVQYIYNGTTLTNADAKSLLATGNTSDDVAATAGAAVMTANDGVAAGTVSGGTTSSGTSTTGNPFTLNAATAILNSTNANLGTTQSGTTNYLTGYKDTIVGGNFTNGTSNWNITDTTAADADEMSWTTTNPADAPVISGIETLNIQSLGGGATLAGITGNTLINVTGAGATFTNAIANETFAIANTFTGTLDIDGAGGLSYNITTTGATATLDGNGTGTGSSFVITNSGTSSISVIGDAGAGNTDVTVKGSGAVSLSVDNVVNTITATDLTGTLSMTTAVQSTVLGGSGNDSITGGAFAADFIYGAAGDDTINVSAGTGASDVRGGAGNDSIVLNSTPSTDDQLVRFEATAAVNGYDTITGFAVGNAATANVSTFNFNAFISGADASGDRGVIKTDGTAAVGAATIASGDCFTTTASTSDIVINNYTVAFDNGGTALTAATLAAEFGTNADGTAFGVVAGQRAVILEGHSGVAANGVTLWYVYDADGSGTIAESEVVKVGVISAIDLATVYGNQIV